MLFKCLSRCGQWEYPLYAESEREKIILNHFSQLHFSKVCILMLLVGCIRFDFPRQFSSFISNTVDLNRAQIGQSL